MSRLPRAIRNARVAAGLSQAELAAKLGVAPSTVAGWELGTHSVRSTRFRMLARVVGVDVTTLFEAA